MIEQGKRNPSASTLSRLASFFAVTTDYLIGKGNFGIKVIYEYDKRTLAGMIDDKELDRLTGTNDLEEVVTNAGIERYVTGKSAYDMFASLTPEKVLEKIDELYSLGKNKPNNSAKSSTYELSASEREMLDKIRRLLPSQFDIVHSLIDELYNLDYMAKKFNKIKENEKGEDGTG